MVFGNVVKYIKRKKRIFSDVKVINEVGNYLDEICTTIHTMNSGRLLGVYIEITENANIVRIIDQYSDLMTLPRKKDEEYIDTGGLVNIAFHRIANNISEEDSVEMLEYICYKNNMLQKTCTLEHSEKAWDGMEFIAKKYPNENKLKFYTDLEQAGFLENLIFKDTTGYGIGNFVSYAMKGVNTETALPILKTSSAWKAVEKDQDLRNGFLQRGEERLLPALNY